MASNCTLGIQNLVKTTLNNKPWFEYNQLLGIVNILDSPKNRINKQSSYGVAKTTATAINKQINNGYKNIGDIAFAKFDEQGRGYVDITPTINQIQLINAQDEKEIYELQKQLDEERKILDDIKNKEEGNYDVVDGEIVVFSKNEYDNEANILRFSDLRQELRVQEGKLNFKNGKISNFEILSENSVIDKEISQQQALEIFNKKNKTNQDKKDLSIYFANYFLNSVYDKEGLLYLGYTRFLRYGITPPKLLIVKDNGRKNPFFQYNNVIIIGLDQIEDLINNVETATFEKFENLINTVAQEEIIHLYADYILDHQDIDNIYNEMTEKDIEQIKKTYGNSSIQKENIVHEYVRMVVQQKVFGKTTEYETFTLSNALMSFFENLLERLNDFLSTIIGSTNTQKAIEDVINFTKGNFSKELDEKIINRVFNKGQILEANLNVLNNFQEEQKELDKIVENINNLEDETKSDILQVGNSSLNQIIKPRVEELFETDSNLANAVYEALGFEIPTTKLQGKQFEYGEPRFFDVVEELTSGERASLPSSILINKLLKGEYLPEIKESQIILGLSEAGIWRPNIKKIEASGENKSTLAKKIGHELLHSVTNNIILSYQNLKGVVDFNDKYNKDNIRQGYIKPVDLTKSQIEALDNLVRIRNKVISYVEQNKDKIQKQDRGFGTYDYFIRTNYTESETDLHEFISEVFTNPELINILKEIPTEGKKSNLFKDFVDAIAKILGFTNTSILEDIIAYSEEAFFTQPQITPQQKQQATFMFSEFLNVYLQDFEQVEKILKEEKIIDKKCS
jgi:hypothetical protein